MARLRGLVRRSGAAQAARGGSVLAVGDLQLDEDSHEVVRGGRDIHLTATEFELLRYLMRNPRRVLSKAQILDACGPTTSAGRPTWWSSTSPTCAGSWRAVSAWHR